jgi:hypothetical protein
MRCPHCHINSSRVTETRRIFDDVRRLHLCRGCGHSFTSIESVFVWRGQREGWVQPPPPPSVGACERRPAVVESTPEPAPAPAPNPSRARTPRFMPEVVPDELRIPPRVQALLLDWWRESRWSKHGAKAVWTERAWRATVARVAGLPPEDQLRLCQAAVEAGWQSIRVEYLESMTPNRGSGRQSQPMSGGPRPSDPRMVAALRMSEGGGQWTA